jgi:tRNA modification GTPase
VATKADLAFGSRAWGPLWPTSAVTGAGLSGLRQAMADVLRRHDAGAEAIVSTGPRCRDSLTKAGECLESAARTLVLGGGDELVAIDLRTALDELGKVVGAVVTDDILDRIFERFCIGK